MLNRFQGSYLILNSYPDFRTFKIQHCETKKVHPSLIHADRLRLCDHDREKLYSRHFVPSTKVKTRLKRDRQSRAANADNTTVRQQKRNEERIDSKSDGKTDRPSAELVGSKTAGQHLSPRRLLSSRREGVTGERDTTTTSQSAPGLQTALGATEQQNIGNDEANTAAQQEKTFPTRIIFLTKRPTATRNVTDGASSLQAALYGSAQSDNPA